MKIIFCLLLLFHFIFGQCTESRATIKKVSSCLNGECEIITNTVAKFPLINSAEATCLKIVRDGKTIKEYKLGILQAHFSSTIKNLGETGSLEIFEMDKKCACPCTNCPSMSEFTSECPSIFAACLTMIKKEWREAESVGCNPVPGPTSMHVKFGLKLHPDYYVYRASEPLFKGILSVTEKTRNGTWKQMLRTVKDAYGYISEDGRLKLKKLKHESSPRHIGGNYIFISRSSPGIAALVDRKHVNTEYTDDVNKLMFAVIKDDKVSMNIQKIKNAIKIRIAHCRIPRLAFLARLLDPNSFLNNDMELEKKSGFIYRIVSHNTNINDAQMNRHFLYNSKIIPKELNELAPVIKTNGILFSDPVSLGELILAKNSSNCKFRINQEGTWQERNYIDIRECKENYAEEGTFRDHVHVTVRLFHNGGRCLLSFFRPDTSRMVTSTHTFPMLIQKSSKSVCCRTTLTADENGIITIDNAHSYSEISKFGEYINMPVHKNKKIELNLEILQNIKVGKSLQQNNAKFNVTACTVTEEGQIKAKISSDKRTAIYIFSDKGSIVHDKLEYIKKGVNWVNFTAVFYGEKKTTDLDFCSIDNVCNQCRLNLEVKEWKKFRFPSSPQSTIGYWTWVVGYIQGSSWTYLLLMFNFVGFICMQLIPIILSLVLSCLGRIYVMPVINSFRYFRSKKKKNCIRGEEEKYI